MKKLSKDEIKRLIECDNVIKIFDEQLNYNFTFYYIYSGDSKEAVFLNNRFYGYFDLDDYIDKIKTRKDEKKYLTKLLKEEYYNKSNTLKYYKERIHELYIEINTYKKVLEMINNE